MHPEVRIIVRQSGIEMDREALRKDPLMYTYCYCEENIYNLLKQQADPRRCAVLFISNAERTVAVWEQRGRPLGKPVVWDYHVVLVCMTESGGLDVYDFDSLLPFPSSLDTYLLRAFQDQSGVLPPYRACFRVAHGPDYLAWFSSDRRHMRGEDGGWNARPPMYPIICGPAAQAAGCPHMLPLMWDVCPAAVQVALAHAGEGNGAGNGAGVAVGRGAATLPTSKVEAPGLLVDGVAGLPAALEKVLSEQADQRA